MDAQFGVEVRQRLVEQEHVRIADDGAADRDALALAAGQLARIAVEQRVELQRRRGLVDAPRRAPRPALCAP